MKRFLLIGMFLAALASPAFAATKSHTVSVSCTVPPMIEISSPSTSARSADIRTSLDKHFQMTEQVRMRDGQRVRLCSLTAL